jgi:hypothetical protein
MNACVLILGQPDSIENIPGACQQHGLRPLYLLPEGQRGAQPGGPAIHLNDYDPQGILSIARQYHVQGIFPADPDLGPLAAEAAQVLELPHVPYKGDKAFLLVECREDLARRRVPVAAARVCVSRAEAETAVEQLQGSAWIQGFSPGAEPFIMRVDHPADAPLAVGQASDRSGSEAVLVQPAVDGPTYCVYGFKEHYGFRPVDVVAEHRAAGHYPYIERMTLPAGTSGRHHAQLTSLADAAAHAIPLARGPVALRFALLPDGPVLVDARFIARPPAQVCELFRLAYGLDLLADALAVNTGTPPRSTSNRELAACVHWLPAHSGVVEEISGADEAAALRGVDHIRINAAPGTQLGHATDAETRDAVGFVVTHGPTIDLANEFATQAIAAITLKASNVSPVE